MTADGLGAGERAADRLEETLDAFTDGLAFLDDDGVIIFVNARIAQLTGMPAAALAGASLWEVFPEALGTEFERAFRRVLVDRTRTQVRQYSERYDVWLDCTLHPTSSGVVLYARDATTDERMRREAEAAQQRVAEQAALLDASRDAVVVRSLEGVVQYWNSAAAELYAWSADEAEGRGFRELVTDHSDEFEAAMRATLRVGYWNGELHETTRDGREITVDSRWQLLRDADGAPRGVFSLGSDVTQWRADEEARLRARRLESLGTLAGGIAHDLNNVLTPILMAVQLLEPGEQDAGRRELLATMETAARRGADMVGQVLAFARGVDGRRERIAMRALLDELLAVARDLLPDGITLELDVDRPLPLLIGDSTQLLQVMTNLVTNARDAMPAGGSLVIRASTVEDASDHSDAPEQDPLERGRPDPPGRIMAITVTDTGSGMAPEVAEKVFEPFFTTKPLGSGTGLGLATSLSIVRSHGGTIRIDSAPGRGTRVEVLLPAAEGAAGADETVAEAPEPLPRGSDELVLIIDDDASIRTAVAHGLIAHGYRVLRAADGAEGIALLEDGAEPVDVVLTDMMMPVMDGAATSAYLEQHHPSIPIIATSGLATHAALDEDGPGLGIAAFLAKPYTTSALLRVLRRVLDRPVVASAAPPASPDETLGRPG